MVIFLFNFNFFSNRNHLFRLTMYNFWVEYSMINETDMLDLKLWSVVSDLGVVLICKLDWNCTIHEGAAGHSGLHVWRVMWRSWVRAPSKAPVVSLSKKLSSLSTGWFQEWIQTWFHNQTKLSWGPYGRLT